MSNRDNKSSVVDPMNGAIETKDSLAIHKNMQPQVYEWGDNRRFNSYSAYFKRLFGSRIQKVTIDAGFTCPNRDGSVSRGGCTFCNNRAFNPSYCMPESGVADQIRNGIKFHAHRYQKANRFLAYFQAYSNTYKPLDQLRAIYDEALSVEGIEGLVIGTRPDCVDEEKLDYFAELSKHKYVILEYGVESIHDHTLKAINRGHDFMAAKRAIEMTAERGIKVGAHFILGLPGETQQMMIDQTQIINSLPLDTIKFHQLQVVRGTAMELDFAQNPQNYMSWDSPMEYIDFFIDILQRLRGSLVVERFVGESPLEFHVPNGINYWRGFRNESLLQMLERRLKERDAYQGQLVGIDY